MEWRPPAAPVRAFRDRYVAPFAGVSYDLAPRAVGVHPGHLARVPELADKEVLVSHDGLRPIPLSRRPAFRIVELTGRMRDALSHAEHGVVFSVFDLDDPIAGHVLGTIRPGESLFLNSAMDRFSDEVVRRPDSAA